MRPRKAPDPAEPVGSPPAVTVDPGGNIPWRAADYLTGPAITYGDDWGGGGDFGAYNGPSDV